MKAAVGVSRTAFIISCTACLLIGLVIGAFALGPLVVVPPKETLVIMGSTTVLPVVEECARVYMKRDLGTDIRVSGGGSGVGITNLIDGICDIAMSSREPKPKEIEKAKAKGVNMVLHAIAIDALSVIVHPTVEDHLGGPLNLTLVQVGKIFIGEWDTWNDVFSEVAPHKLLVMDELITVFVREPGSGTRGTFEDFIFDVLKEEGYPEEELVCVGHEKHGNPALRDAVEDTRWSIGYVGLGFVEEPHVRAVHLYNEAIGDYVEPSKEAVKDGTYPMSRKLYLITNGEPPEGSLADRFIDFVLSQDGQAIVEENGFIAIVG